ncbi:hypothetical protein T02_6477 [Trichinella nativa]|uniref:Uncharacterized protein n=1 Tax=Trichinella nativa TaxID=6335 RepID=A0A0V1LF88_9BILA|nr:hypothetical protein T02_6477 [Trichinella nativa]
MGWGFVWYSWKSTAKLAVPPASANVRKLSEGKHREKKAKKKKQKCTTGDLYASLSLSQTVGGEVEIPRRCCFLETTAVTTGHLFDAVDAGVFVLRFQTTLLNEWREAFCSGVVKICFRPNGGNNHATEITLNTLSQLRAKIENFETLKTLFG